MLAALRDFTKPERKAIGELIEEVRESFGNPHAHRGSGTHGENEAKVYADLCAMVEEAIEDRRTARHPLPEPAIGQQYSGKFLLRTGASLQKALAVRACREGKSLNQVCLEAIRPAALAAPAGKARRKLATA